MIADLPADTVQGQVELVNAVGLHARPSVKLTQLAKTFSCRVEIAAAADGPWVDAKSPVKVMRLSAPGGTILHIRATGAGANDATEALLNLVRSGFGELTVGGEAAHG